MQKRTVLIAAGSPEAGARLLASATGLSTLCLHARSIAEAERLLRALTVDVLVIDGTLERADQLALFARALPIAPRIVQLGPSDEAERAIAVSAGLTR